MGNVITFAVFSGIFTTYIIFCFYFANFYSICFGNFYKIVYCFSGIFKKFILSFWEHYNICYSVFNYHRIYDFTVIWEGFFFFFLP